MPELAEHHAGVDQWNTRVERDMYDLLLISAGFFDYTKEIMALLEKRKRHVLWFEDRPATDTITKALLRTIPLLVREKADAYFDRIIDQARHFPIRDVFVIKGEALSPAALRRMKQAFPKARFTLYFWDSYRNMPQDSPAKVDFFDRAFTFDPVDAAGDLRLGYRPLFFLDEYVRLPQVRQDIDVLFVGTVHTDRYAVLNRLTRTLPQGLRVEKVLYFPSHLIYRARRLTDPSFWGARMNEFIFQPVAKADLTALVARSRIVVDIERPIQSGYTIRTIEIVASGRKLITTNSSVSKADFYFPENILIVDRKKPIVPQSFLRAEFKKLSDGIMQRYSLEGWLNDILPV